MGWKVLTERYCRHIHIPCTEEHSAHLEDRSICLPWNLVSFLTYVLLPPVAAIHSPSPQDQVVFEGKGIVLAEDEGEDIAVALGPKKAALLRNHGLLTVGQTIEEAVQWFYTLDKCCHAQLLADAAASGRGGETNKITDEEAEYSREIAGTPKAGWFGGKMLFDLIDKETGRDYMA